MISPVPMPMPMPLVDMDQEESLPSRARDAWEEHQRRQRSIRMLMMFLMILILMDGEEPPSSSRKKSLRGKRKKRSSAKPLSDDLWKKRVGLDGLIWDVGKGHDRFQNLIELNNGTDEASSALEWAYTSILVKDPHDKGKKEKEEEEEEEEGDRMLGESDQVQAAKEAFDKFQEEEKLVYHYPRNATGSYRGKWKRIYDLNGTTKSIFYYNSMSWSNHEEKLQKERNATATATQSHVISDEELLSILPSTHIGLHLLPPRMRLDEIVHSTGASGTSNLTEINHNNDTVNNFDSDQTLDFTKDEGSMVIRLYTRKITGMNQVSLVDGVVILYDVNDRTFTSHMKHLTLRVRGIVLHSLGKISLVANDGPLRSAFVVNHGNSMDRRNLQEETLDDDKDSALNRTTSVEDLRDEVLSTHDVLFNNELGGENWTLHFQYGNEQSSSRRLLRENGYVASNPFLPDDRDGTLHTTPSNVLRATTPLIRENGLGCEFELEFNTTEKQWTRAEWRNVMKHIVLDTKKTFPKNLVNQTNKRSKDGTADQQIEDTNIPSKQDLVMHMVGTIVSHECNFLSTVNVTAIRTDWERTSAKAINYCFFMMVACLAQTVFLLRQMIYSQAQSAAVRISLLTVGWQTVLDAILCIEHIFLCLLLQPVSTAFGKYYWVKNLFAYNKLHHILCSLEN